MLIVQYVVVVWSSISQQTTPNSDLGEEFACQCQCTSIEESGVTQDSEQNFCWQ
jgi:hypothetical protein